jgi:hypothetical protein
MNRTSRTEPPTPEANSIRWKPQDTGTRNGGWISNHAKPRRREGVDRTLFLKDENRPPHASAFYSRPKAFARQFGQFFLGVGVAELPPGSLDRLLGKMEETPSHQILDDLNKSR